jgi:hypothetical protein
MDAPISPDASPEPDLVFSIAPDPTADERDAVLAALTILLESPALAVSPAGPDAPSRWARAGREAALRSRQLRHDWRGR